jgi:outer membrane protein OmpA-like peptidoglycan-associated protein
VIKHPSTRLVAAVLLLAGLAIATLLNRNDASDKSRSDAPAVPAPRFEIVWRHGELTLAGHTLSANHEQDLLTAAAKAFPNSPLHARFEPLEAAPAHWADTSTHLIYLLADTETADATLTPSTIHIRSISSDTVQLQNRLDTWTRALPQTINVSAENLLVDTDIDASAACAKAFDSFDPGPINFEESSAVFRSSAFPRLDRLIALARTCNQSMISVTGHTDASGNETANQKLSLMRAEAVADYLVAGGVDRDQLQTTGIGSAVPVADDKTRYGRSLNRRIEVSLSSD